MSNHHVTPRYLVLSQDEQWFIVKTADGTLDWLSNNNRNVPHMFCDVKGARNCADVMHGKVRRYYGNFDRKGLRYNDVRR